MDMQHCEFDQATPKDCITCWDFEECPYRKRSGSVLGWYLVTVLTLIVTLIILYI